MTIHSLNDRWTCVSVVALLGAWVSAAGAQTATPPTTPSKERITIEGPVQGWNYKGFVDRTDENTLAYPNSPIDRGAQRGRTMIRGKAPGSVANNATAVVQQGIEQAGKERKRPNPPKLVVNGNAMLLWADEKGSYARPYAFGRGSNSIEVRSADGRERKRVQFYEANPNTPSARIRIICTWDDNAAEVDMHVITPDGQHAFWAKPALSNGGGFDADSVDGAGPEMFSMAAPLRGLYQIYVNYWGNYNSAGYNFDENNRQQDVITTQITIIFEENTSKERRETYVIPLRKVGDLAMVRQFRY